MPEHIELRGVRVHNLKGIDLDLPLRKLTVLTGVAGAGKSSLAFDTLFAESQRRYIQSFSTSSRQYLERFEPPEAERIGFLPPAIAIRKLPTSWRATVGTLSEAAFDLQVAFSRQGVIVCPDCNTPVEASTPESVARELAALPEGTRCQIAFDWPVTAHTDVWEILRHAGFSRVVVGEETVDLRGAEAPPHLASSEESVTVIADRVTAGRTDPVRLRESLEMAFGHGGGEAIVFVATASSGGSRRTIDRQSWDERRYSIDPRCPRCRRGFPRPEPALFQHHSALGACPECRGSGVVGGRAKQVCPKCHGDRLRPDALAVLLDGRNFAHWTSQPVRHTRETWSTFLGALTTDAREQLGPLAGRFAERLRLLEEIGLGYLSLSRPAATLSAGEARRVQIVAALATRLVNTLCVLDEPTAGLHESEVDRVIRILRQLRDAGNTLVVIEHDPAVLAAADLVLEIGPGAGPEGGRIVSRHSGGIATHQPEPPATQRAESRAPTGTLSLSRLTYRNLEDRTFEFPLGVLCVVAGPAGSGKSSLLEALFALLNGNAAPRNAPALLISGAVHDPIGFAKIIRIDQRPLPRMTRSTPGTVLGVLAPIRQLFAGTPDAQARNYGPLHFSFNATTGGRCSACSGLGELQIDLQFLPDVRTTCPECGGSRFRREVLDIRYRGLNMAEVLAMNSREAFAFFRGLPQLQKRLKSLKDVGLDYLPLGRSAATLSNGEMQRLKLAHWLAKRSRSRTLFLMDEPATGLHAKDIARMIDVFDLLLTSGHSLVIAENKPQILAAADHLIELGRERETTAPA